ncbi:MAG: hypothetical protein AB2L11_09355 [Syntrophobacteraceae bacterium]
MPLSPLILYGFCLVFGTGVLIYGLSLRAGKKRVPAGSDPGTPASDPLLIPDDGLPIEIIEPLVFHEDQFPRARTQGTAKRRFAKLEIFGPSSVFKSLVKAPWSILKRKSGSKGDGILDQPVASGILLDPEAHTESR